MLAWVRGAGVEDGFRADGPSNERNGGFGVVIVMVCCAGGGDVVVGLGGG